MNRLLGGAVGIVVSFFRGNQAIALTMYALTGVMLVAATITPVVATLTSP